MKAITKSTFIGLCLLGSTLTAGAQLKLHSNGKLSFQRTDNSEPLSPISFSEGGSEPNDSTFFISYAGDGYNGIEVSAHNGISIQNRSFGGLFECSSNLCETVVGLKGSGVSAKHMTSINPGSVGLWGYCNVDLVNRYGYGVLGSIFGNRNSAAVCGVTSAWVPSAAIPDTIYAGLFVGKTKVVGNLEVTGSVRGVTIVPSPTANGGQQRATSGESMTEKMQNLSTIAYRHPQEETEMIHLGFLKPEKKELSEMERLGIDPSETDKPEEDVMTRQIQEKEHYALSIKELEEAFPDLVYEDKNGEKNINYVEMVPLLVQCINELNARLSALDGNVIADPVPARSDAATHQVTGIGKTVATQAVLQQNTPNPFTAQTEIRF